MTSHAPDQVAELENLPRKIDVQIENDADGAQRVVLRDLSYAEGIGWYAQKTVRLDSAHVDALLGALCCARQQISTERSGPTGGCSHQLEVSRGADRGANIVSLTELGELRRLRR